MRKGDPRNTSRYTVKVLCRTAGVLQAIAESNGSCTLDDISRELHLHRATVYRILTTLEREGLVERTAEGRVHYTLGLGCMLLGTRMMASTGTTMARTQSVVNDVARRTGETAGLYLRWGKERVCVAAARGPRVSEFRIDVGVSSSLCAGAAGRVLLAHMPYQEAKRIIEEMLPAIHRYPGTPSEVDVMLRELTTVRERGFAVSRSELAVDGVSVAVPVWSERGSTVAALGVAGKAERVPEERIPELVVELVSSAKRLPASLSLMGLPTEAGSPG